MGWMQFVAELSKALAWPLAAVSAAILFRAPVRAWFKERPSKLKLGPVEAQWSTALADTETALEGHLPTGGQTSKSATLELLTREQPALAVAVASERLEAIVQKSVGSISRHLASGSLGDGVERAAKSGSLSAGTIAALRNLASLRNLALHSPGTVSSQQSAEFVRLADATAHVIEAETQISRRMADGSDNIDPDHVLTVIKRDGPGRAVALALRGDSSVKRRQVAAILARNGHLGEAVDLALKISNRSEARTVGRKLLEYAASNPEAGRGAIEQLRRLWPHLDEARHRELRDAASELGIAIPTAWDNLIDVSAT